MAKLASLPASAVIDSLAGTIDYYLYMGIPVARSWPRARSIPPTPQEQQQWPIFTIAINAWSQTTPYIQDAYRSMASASTLSGRDMASKLYLNGTTIMTNVLDNAFNTSR